MSQLKHGLSGFVPVRNAISLDYCFQECVNSLLPVCDEVIICDSDSSDGTKEMIEEWETREPKIRVANWPWPRVATYDEWKADKPRPPGDPRLLIRWLNYTRQFCLYDTQISLDADEVLCPKGYSEIKRAVEDRTPRWLSRINFWKSPFFEAPHGTVCGERVAKIGPTEYETVSDEPREEGEPPMRSEAIFHDSLRIFHMGFLRRQDAFFAKSKVMQGALHSTYDPRLVKAEEQGTSWADESPFDKPLIPYPYNDHPPAIRAWLQERGYKFP